MSADVDRLSPDVDLVMMSKASTPALQAMTQEAIVTAKYGALPHVVNAIVMEQTHCEYRHATTVYAPDDPFCYNAVANRGAKMGKAPWIVFANNDLRFGNNWLEKLLRANNPVVSPRSPGYHRHNYVMANERGWQVGRHLAGWCFMMARWLWDELGGLDETYGFWCSDNAVMDQLIALGHKPMLVRDAVVSHLVSATLSQEPHDVQDEMTWATLHQYNQDNDQNQHLVNHPRYLDWKRRKGIV